MLIHSLTYTDHARSWHLEKTTFKHLTLLVGASGVGKTQILQALSNVGKIAKGASLNGVQWCIEFEMPNGRVFTWEGEFETTHETQPTFDFALGDMVKPRISEEKLESDEEQIIVRSEGETYFKGQRIIKLPGAQSAIYLLREEELIEEIYYALEYREKVNFFSDWSKIYVPTIENYASIADIREAHEHIRSKLYLASSISPEVFREIRDVFINIFPFVEDMRIEIVGGPGASMMTYPSVQIQEKGVTGWIEESKISHGMLRTLLQIGDLYLCADGTIFLIDEFENGLGINCIDDLTTVLLNYHRDLQFIITSHHPYIINNIGYEHWKIVTRYGGRVIAKDASEYNLGASKHEAFTQLINLDAYEEGVGV